MIKEGERWFKVGRFPGSLRIAICWESLDRTFVSLHFHNEGLNDWSNLP
jgi:hypothetical protein